MKSARDITARDGTSPHGTGHQGTVRTGTLDPAGQSALDSAVHFAHSPALGDVREIVFCLVGASRLEHRGTRFADFWNAFIPKLLVRALGTLQFGATTDAQWARRYWVEAQVTAPPQDSQADDLGGLGD